MVKALRPRCKSSLVGKACPPPRPLGYTPGSCKRTSEHALPWLLRGYGGTVGVYALRIRQIRSPVRVPASPLREPTLALLCNWPSLIHILRHFVDLQQRHDALLIKDNLRIRYMTNFVGLPPHRETAKLPAFTRCRRAKRPIPVRFSAPPPLPTTQSAAVLTLDLEIEAAFAWLVQDAANKQAIRVSETL